MKADAVCKWNARNAARALAVEARARRENVEIAFSIGAKVGGLLAPSKVARVGSSFAENAPTSALTGALTAQEAATLRRRLHHPGARDAHRELLQRAMTMLEAALAAEQGNNEHNDSGASLQRRRSWPSACRALLLDVYGAFVEDARHGAGQLSRSAQRAPCEADCDDGWRRVETIVRGAEDVAEKAAALRRDDDPPHEKNLIEHIARAARAARIIVDERNHAYTFHATPGFSFGEGWYAAAAAVLGGVCLQVEPDQKHSVAAARFLLAAGLAPQLRAYHSRPRANKALPQVVADAFRRDAMSAQTRLRGALLGDSEVVLRVHGWLDARLRPSPNRLTVLVWNRQCRHHAHRNSSSDELAALCSLAVEAGLQPILIGDGLVQLPPRTLDLTLFWKEPLFQGLEMRRAQLEVFEYLRDRYGLVGQVGVTTAGMDGPALLGLPTLYLTREPNVRLGRWVGVVPGYEEVVRDGTHLTRVATRFWAWAKPRTTRCGASDAVDGPSSVARNT